MSTDIDQKPKQKKTPIVLLLVFLVFTGLVFWWQRRMPVADVVLAGQKLHVMVANTPARQIKGLGGRDSLAPYDGMLFLFLEPKKYAFVMRDMRFSIDIVWLYHGEVVDIAPSLPLDTAPEEQLMNYRPRKEATSVLELPAGWAAAHGLKIGDIMTIPQ